MDRLKLTTKELKQQALDRLTNRAKLIPDVNVNECIDYLKTTFNNGRIIKKTGVPSKIKKEKIKIKYIPKVGDIKIYSSLESFRNRNKI